MTAFRSRPGVDRPASPRRSFQHCPEVVVLESRLLMATIQSSTALFASAAYVVPGQSLTLTATVTYTDPAPFGTPLGTTISGGTIEFFDGSKELGSEPVNGPSPVDLQFPLNSLASGAHTFSATFSGANLYLPPPENGIFAYNLAGSSSGVVSTYVGNPYLTMTAANTSLSAGGSKR